MDSIGCTCQSENSPHFWPLLRQQISDVQRSEKVPQVSILEVIPIGECCFVGPRVYTLPSLIELSLGQEIQELLRKCIRHREVVSCPPSCRYLGLGNEGHEWINF